MGAPPEVLYLDTAVATDAGKVIRLGWKCWRHSAQVVQWELREAVYTSGVSAKERLHKYISSRSQSWEAHFQKLGMSCKDVLWPSRRAASALSEAAVVDPMVQQEFTATTLGLMCLLCVWRLERRLMEQRAACRFILQAWLQVWVDWLLPVFGERLHQFTTLEKGSCSYNAHAGCCAHVHDFFRALGSHDLAAWPGCCAAFLQLHKSAESQGCPALLSRWLDVATVAAATMDSRPQVLHRNPLHRQPLLGGHGRKRRLDEAYVAAASIDVVTKRQAKSAEAWSRAHADHGLSRGHAHTFDNAELRKYLVAGQRLFADAKYISVCLDGSRLRGFTKGV